MRAARGRRPSWKPKASKPKKVKPPHWTKELKRMVGEDGYLALRWCLVIINNKFEENPIRLCNCENGHDSITRAWACEEAMVNSDKYILF